MNFQLFKPFIFIIIMTVLLIIANMILGSQLAKQENKFDVSVLVQSLIKYFWLVLVSILIYAAGYFGDELLTSILGNAVSDIPLLKSLVSLGLAYYAYTKAKEVYEKYSEYTGLKQIQNKKEGE